MIRHCDALVARVGTASIRLANRDTTSRTRSSVSAWPLDGQVTQGGFDVVYVAEIDLADDGDAFRIRPSARVRSEPANRSNGLCSLPTARSWRLPNSDMQPTTVCRVRENASPAETSDEREARARRDRVRRGARGMASLPRACPCSSVSRSGEPRSATARHPETRVTRHAGTENGRSEPGAGARCRQSSGSSEPVSS